MKRKRWISALLTAAMLLVALPASALEAGAAEAGTPELTRLTVEAADGREISLLEGDVAEDLGESYSFTAVFDHPEQIESVYITSTKGSAVRLLEARWDGGAYTTSGWFGGVADYIPGKIGVEYTVKTEEPDIGGEVDWDALELEGADAQVTAGSGQAVQATVDLAGLLEAEGEVAVNVAVDIFDETTGGNLNDWLGAYQELELLNKYVLDGGKYVLYLDYSDPSAYAVIVHDISGSKLVKTVLDETAGASGTLQKLSEQLGNLKTVSGLASQFFTIQDSAEQLRDQVSGRTDLKGEEKEQLNERIDDYENDRLLFTLTMTVLPAVVAASGGTLAGPALVFNALVGAINAASNFFWDYRVGMISGCDPVDSDFTPTAHGIPLTRDLLWKMDYTITEGGTYYLAESVSPDIHIDGVGVTICKHGYGCTLVNDGGFLDVRDCAYEEDLDGNMIGSSLFAEVINNDGDVSVSGCRVSVDTAGEGRVTVYECRVTRVSAEGDGDISIYGGTVERIENGTGELTVHNGRIDRITNNGGTVRIERGQMGAEARSSKAVYIENKGGTMYISGLQLWGRVENAAGASLTISDAVIIGRKGGDDSYAIDNEGALTIWNGTFSYGDRVGDGTCIANRGTAEIFDGQFVGSIGNSARNPNGGLTIHDGSFQSYGTNVENSWGTVTIEGGEFQALGPHDYDANVSTRAGNGKTELETVIRGGTFYCASGSCVKNVQGTGVMPMPRTTIEGGSFYSAAADCVNNSGEMTISGGTFSCEDLPAFSGCVTNWDDGALSISGGAFICLDFAPCVYSDDNLDLTISGGTFLAPESLSVIEGMGCTLLVGENSDIEMSACRSALTRLFEEGFRTDEFQLTVATPAGYDGKILWYDAPEGEGLAVTPVQLAGMDFSGGHYLRLVGDASLTGASPEGVTVSLSGQGEELRTAAVSAPEGVLAATDIRVWAASYEGGKMTAAVSGVLRADGTVTFSRPLETGMRLFFLDGESRPVCGSLLLQADKTE